MLNPGAVPTGPVDVTVGDLDGDGDSDVIVAVCCGTVLYSNTRQFVPASHRVWLNNGLGHFSLRGQSLGDLGIRAVALGDLDADGDLDAFLGNSYSVRDAQSTFSRNEPNTVWLNDGTGQFTDSGQRLGSCETESVALGDLDGDGDLDAFVGNGSADEVWLNDGRGNFANSGQGLGNSRTRHVALGDVDGDGDLDALTDAERQSQVWFNDGTGSFKCY